MIVGVSGYKRNAAVAAYCRGLAAVCEEGRVTRVRDVGIEAGGFPLEALGAVLDATGARRTDVTEFVVAERALGPETIQSRALDHHLAHAATAFLSSPFDEALVLVCDTGGSADVTLWRGRGAQLEEIDLAWQGPGFARVYSRLATWLGFQAGRDEYRVEALARLDGMSEADRMARLLRLDKARLQIAPDFQTDIAAVARSKDLSAMARMAGAVQRRLAELLGELVCDAVRRTGLRQVCLGGGLFFNTFVNTFVRNCPELTGVHVPVNPGNAGVSAGCALARGCERDGVVDHPPPASPFLGPQFTNEQIKAVLDNCKLTYTFVDDAAVVTLAVEALARGELVGWFHGRLEWGARALGNRSIFANPFAPYVLENLNRFLKHREAYQSYGLIVCEEEADRFFETAWPAPFMEYEYEVRDSARFAHILPPGVRRSRVQTLGAEPRLLRQLLIRFGGAAGTPVLVNTSFNGFHEPIVCSPRDAVRVFYGTGLDVLVIGNFIVRK